MLKITVLGCGASVGVPSLKYGWGDCDPSNSKNYRLRSSLMVQNNDTSLLIDMSPDLRQQLLNFGNVKLDGVFITHEHYDHVSGINELRPIFFGTNKKVEIYSAPNVIKNLRRMFFYLFEDSGIDVYKPYVSTNEVLKKFSIGTLNCECFEQSHGYMKSLGIRIGNFAYSTDVIEFSEESFKKLYGLDTWIVGCLSYERKTTHADLETVLQWVKKLNPKRTFLTHMGGLMDYDSLLKKLPSNIFPLYDGMEIIV